MVNLILFFKRIFLQFSIGKITACAARHSNMLIERKKCIFFEERKKVHFTHIMRMTCALQPKHKQRIKHTDEKKCFNHSNTSKLEQYTYAHRHAYTYDRCRNGELSNVRLFQMMQSHTL